MTEQQLAHAFELRMAGETYDCIAEALGLEVQPLRKALHAYVQILDNGLEADPANKQKD